MISTDNTTRAGRMIEAGRVTVSFRSPTGQHITLTAKCRGKVDGKWQGVPLNQATIIFIEVPNSGGFGDKVARVNRSGGITPERGADTARVWCANQLLRFVNGQALANGLEAFEEERCGRCGRTLTDPVSIERGIGPECYGQMTGSEHETKVRETPAERSERIARHEAEQLRIRTFNSERETQLADPSHVDPTMVDNVSRVRPAAFQPTQGATDKTGIEYGYGDWRTRKAIAKEEIAEHTEAALRAPSPEWATQLDMLPGSTWEDIFRPAATAKGIELPW